MIVRLLGAPAVIDGDRTLDLRGQKPWALLGRVLLADRPLTRRQLSMELFPDADDPLGALRWALASIRKVLGPATFAGDPVLPGLGDDVSVDVLALRAGALDIESVGELLEGVDPACGPEFSIWLLVARQQVAARVNALLHDLTVRALASRDVQRSVSLAELGARRQPYDERAHVLLVNALVAAGHEEGARKHADEVARRFELELGAPVSPALHAAAATRIVEHDQTAISADAAAEALLAAGRAAIAAGAADAGVDCLRRALATAERQSGEQLTARASLELGSALVHSVRGFDDEGAVLLERAAQIAERLGDTTTACTARRERGYVDALAGRRSEAERHLELATRAAGDDPGLRAGVEGIIGFNLCDWGRAREGLQRLENSIELARSAGDARRECWVLGIGAWAKLHLGDQDAAGEWSHRCLTMVRDLGWLSFEPWPVSVDLERRLVDGPLPAATELERCFAAASHLGDPCWEGAAARLLALHHVQSGDGAAAVPWIEDAERRVRRRSDTWAAMVGAVLTTSAEVHLSADDLGRAELAARSAVAFSAQARLDAQLRHALDVMERVTR